MYTCIHVYLLGCVMPSIGRLRDFKYARLGEWRGFGFFLQNIIEYLIHETDFILCLFTVILAPFPVKYYLHKSMGCKISNMRG